MNGKPTGRELASLLKLLGASVAHDPSTVASKSTSSPWGLGARWALALHYGEHGLKRQTTTERNRASEYLY